MSLTDSALPFTAPETVARADASASAEQRDGPAIRSLGSLVAAMLVCVLAVVSIETSRSAGLVAALWLSGGIAVAGWMLGPRSLSFDVAYGFFVAAAFAIANILVGNTIPQVAMFTFANMVEVVAAVVLIRALVPRLRFDTLIESTRFLLTAPVLAPLPAAMLVAATLSTTTGGDFRSMFETWWFGHAVGFAVAIPFGVTMARLDLKAALKPERIAEAALVLGGLAGVAVMVFVQDTKPVSFLITPLMLLAALRLRIPGAAAAVLIVAVIAIIGTMNGGGPMDVMSASTDEKVRLAQLYVLFGCLPALLVASVLDERDQLAEAARRGQARAEAASAGKSRLLANVSHEIKSPISGVIGIGEMWATGKLGEVTPRQAEMATMLVSTARQIEVLAYDLLNVAKAESGSVSVQIRPVNIEAVVEDVKREAELSPDAAGLRFSIDREAGVEFVALADSVRIAQVLRNLTTNAVKYGASGGVVIFRLSQPQADKVRVEVVDRGPGLTPERVEELFEPFNRLGMERSQVEGHGIGLALAKRLTELQGGTIGVETSSGAGARFWVELPAAA